MEITTLISEDNELKRQIHKLATQEQSPIGDGIVNYEEYLNSSPKILWLLKESYDTENDGEGGWSMAELLNRENVYEKFLKKTKSKNTWYPIIYTSYGILKNESCYEDIPFIEDDESVILILKKIAFININKLAGKSTTNMSELRSKFQENTIILKNQIKLYNPDVIIGCKTLDMYLNLLDLGKVEVKKSKLGTEYYFNENRLYIDAYHPGKIGISRYKNVNENYVDDLISIYRTELKK